MKKIRFAIACIALVGAFTLAATAQNRVLAVADVPFAFTVHDAAFPAGTYEVRQIGSQTIRLQDPRTTHGVTLMSASSIGEARSLTLRFHQYGNQYFLAKVFSPALNVYAVTSVAERELQKSRNIATVVALQAKR
jgi:hypothetical protein